MKRTATLITIREAEALALGAGGLVLGWSGHRPPKLGGYEEWVRERARALARAVIERERPALVVSGMALGVDEAAATAAVDAGVPFLAAVPFVGQERRWPPAARARYERLLERAVAVHVSVPPGAFVEHEAARALHQRNADMVRIVRAGGGAFAVVWDGSSGGTRGCIERAREAGVPIRNYWRSWARYSGARVASHPPRSPRCAARGVGRAASVVGGRGRAGRWASSTARGRAPRSGAHVR